MPNYLAVPVLRDNDTVTVMVICPDDTLSRLINGASQNIALLKERVFPGLDYVAIDGWIGDRHTWFVEATQFVYRCQQLARRIENESDRTLLEQMAHEIERYVDVPRPEPAIFTFRLQSGDFTDNTLANWQAWSGLSRIVLDSMFHPDGVVVVLYQEGFSADLSIVIPYAYFNVNFGSGTLGEV